MLVKTMNDKSVLINSKIGNLEIIDLEDKINLKHKEIDLFICKDSMVKIIDKDLEKKKSGKISVMIDSELFTKIRDKLGYSEVHIGDCSEFINEYVNKLIWDSMR